MLYRAERNDKTSFQSFLRTNLNLIIIYAIIYVI